MAIQKGLGGVDPVEEMFSQTSSLLDTTEALAEASSGPGYILHRAVVREVFYDLSFTLRQEQMMFWAPRLKNKDPLMTAPRNSIIAQIIDNGAARLNKNTGWIVCYPFFPPHLCFPIKPGEHVWLINERMGAVSDIGYWMCRIPQVDFVDDVNYTHNDRAFGSSLIPSIGERGAAESEGAKINKFLFPPYAFPNGTGLAEKHYTLPESKEYERIVMSSAAYQNAFVPDTIPRFTKRPGDIVLQGSNNTLVCLGEDRGWTHPQSTSLRKSALNSPISNASRFRRELKQATPILRGNTSGTIDLVAGRGRYKWNELVNKNNQLHAKPHMQVPTLTEPIGVWNSHMMLDEDANLVSKAAVRDNWIETNKNPVRIAASPIPEAELPAYAAPEDNKDPLKGGDPLRNRFVNPAEGDPDLENDSSRVYLSMNCNVDSIFHIDQPGKTIPYSFFDVGPGEYGSEPGTDDNSDPDVYIANAEQESLLGPLMYDYSGDPEGLDPVEIPDTAGKVQTPAIVIKSDEVRLIARKKKKNDPLPGARPINGSLRLIKEGSWGDTGDGCAIMLLPDGSVQLSGSRLFLGRTLAAGGQKLHTEGEHEEKESPALPTAQWFKNQEGEPTLVEGETGIHDCQPWVRFSDLKMVLEEMCDAIITLCGTADSWTFTGPPGNTMANPGMTVKPFNDMKTKIKTAKEKIDLMKSHRIFGE